MIKTMLKTRVLVLGPLHFLVFCLIVSAILTACAAINATDPGTSPTSPAESNSTTVCPMTEPVWVKPPEDAAVEGSPEYGFYFVNQDRSIWASAWWAETEDYHLRAGEEGIKVGWFRPAGATLEIAGQRVDGQAPPLDAHVPCCYPTRFQATGLVFPTEGCWAITATAAGSELSFVVRVDP